MTPRLEATSPTASNAWSSDTTSIMSPGRVLASQTPAATAIRRSLQSRTPVEGALCTRLAPFCARSRAVSCPITRQFPTAVKSVSMPTRSIMRCRSTYSMSCARLVFSTSKKMPRRCSGRGRGAGGGPMRAANAGSGTIVTTGAGVASTTGSSGRVSGAAASSGAAVRFRVRGWVLRFEVFLPSAVDDRFFVVTAEGIARPLGDRTGRCRGVDSPEDPCSALPACSQGGAPCGP